MSSGAITEKAGGSIITNTTNDHAIYATTVSQNAPQQNIDWKGEGGVVLGDKPKDIKIEKRVVVFYIGGAGDKTSYYFTGPYYNIKIVKEKIELKILKSQGVKFYESYYIGYEEAYNNLAGIVPKIPNKKTSIYIIGHSLGGWNGAHLSEALTKAGYIVEMLITLDPVGEGEIVSILSNIYFSKPNPSAKFWINIKCVPLKPELSDRVANFGEQWKITSGPNINVDADVSHYDAIGMFEYDLGANKSVPDYINKLFILIRVFEDVPVISAADYFYESVMKKINL